MAALLARGESRGHGMRVLSGMQRRGLGAGDRVPSLWLFRALGCVPSARGGRGAPDGGVSARGGDALSTLQDDDAGRHAALLVGEPVYLRRAGFRWRWRSLRGRACGPSLARGAVASRTRLARDGVPRAWLSSRRSPCSSACISCRCRRGRGGSGPGSAGGWAPRAGAAPVGLGGTPRSARVRPVRPAGSRSRRP